MGKSGGGLITTVDEGLNLGEVGWVSDEVRELLAEAALGQLEETVELLPELVLKGHGSALVEFHVVELEGIQDAESGLVTLISLEVSQLAGLGEEEKTESGMAGHTDEVGESFGITLRDQTSIDSLGESELEGVLTVVLPHALEVRLVGDLGRHLVGHHHVFSLDDLGGELAKSLVLLLESGGTLGSGRVHAEQDVGILVGVGERVEDAVSLLVAVVSEHVALLLLPGELGNFVVEETVAIAAPEVLEADELEEVRLLTLTSELLGSPLSLEVVESVLPGLARVGIDIPSVHLLALGPVGDAEALEDSTGLSVHGDVSHTLEDGLRMEVLSVDVVHDVRLLVELVAIDILNAKAYIIIKIKISTRIQRKTRQHAVSGLTAPFPPKIATVAFSWHICRKS